MTRRSRREMVEGGGEGGLNDVTPIFGFRRDVPCNWKHLEVLRFQSSLIGVHHFSPAKKGKRDFGYNRRDTTRRKPLKSLDLPPRDSGGFTKSILDTICIKRDERRESNFTGRGLTSAITRNRRIFFCSKRGRRKWVEEQEGE